MARIRSIHPGLIPRHRSADVRYLYVISEEGSDGPVKIGRADHPLWRMSSLQGGNSRRLVLLAVWVSDRSTIIALEKAVHGRFPRRRVAFEWFRVTLPEVEAAVAEFQL